MKKKNITKPKQKGIILNKMYSGAYLAKGNLGHEIINLYKSDNGKNYIYVMSDGEYNLNYDIDCVLLARVINNSYFEILGKATGLEPIYANVEYPDQKKYIEDNEITYAGVSLNDIFTGDDYQDICITFKAEKVVKPNEPMYVKFAKGTNDDIPFQIGVNSGQSTKQYILEKRDEQSYQELCGIINNSSLWGNEVETINLGNDSETIPHTIFDICGITHYELAHSKAIGNLLRRHREFADKFVKEVLGLNEGLVGEYTVKMETEHRIDIFIADEKKCIIIENKIKSGINGIELNEQSEVVTTQLDKYLEAVKEDEQNRAEALSKEGKKPVEQRDIKAYLLSPDYNIITINRDDYSEILYSKLHGVMSEYLENDKSLTETDRVNFKIITDAFKRHTLKYDNTLFEEMEKLFSYRLKK